MVKIKLPTQQKNKMYAFLLIIFLLLSLLVSFLFFNKNTIFYSENELENQKSILAKYALIVDDSAIKSYSFKNKEINDSVKFDSDILGYSDQNNKSFYAYNFKTLELSAYSLNKEGKITKSLVCTSKLKDKPIEIVASDKYLFALTDTKAYFFSYTNTSNIKEYIYTEKLSSDKFILNNKLYFSCNNNLICLNLDTGEELINYNIGEKTTNMFYSDNKLVIINKFGSTKNNNTLLLLDLKSNLISFATFIEGQNNLLLSNHDSNNLVFYLYTNSDQSKDSKLKAFNTKENTEKLITNINADFHKNNTDYVYFEKGYLYILSNSGLKYCKYKTTDKFESIDILAKSLILYY